MINADMQKLQKRVEVLNTLLHRGPLRITPGGRGGSSSKRYYARVLLSLDRGDITTDPPRPARNKYQVLLVGQESLEMWTVGDEYAADAVVYHGSDYYKCIITHKAKQQWNEPPNETYWEKLTGEDIGEEAGVLGYSGSLLESAPWFHADDIVEVVRVGDYDEVGDLIADTVAWKIAGTVMRVEKSQANERIYSIIQLQSTTTFEPTRVAAVFG